MTVGPELSRPNGISYLHIPATDPAASARFYQAAFSWAVYNLEGPEPGFEDGTGHVAGAWVRDQAVQREAGLLLYIYVDDAEAAARRIVDAGGEMVEGPRPEGTLRVGTFRDPAGNLLGIWQETAG
ncbi:MAG: VOC family protein [Candidatus Dormibacteraeota bacterium]|nr:VOC family protein [Candidatus Dormibacteraeota bacterium]